MEQSTRRILGLVVAGSLLFAFFTGAPRVVQSLIDMIGQRHQTPKQVIIEFQKALHELDDPAANELFLTTDDESESSSFEWTSEEELHFNELYTHFEVEILDSRINGDNAVVTTRLSNLNMDHVYETFSANFYNYEYDNQILAEDADPYVEIDKIFLDLMRQETSRVSFVHDIKLVKVAGRWKFLLDDVLYDQMLGNYFEEMNEAYYEYDAIFDYEDYEFDTSKLKARRSGFDIGLRQANIRQ